MTTTQIALARLAELNCDKLPTAVRNKIVEDFVNDSTDSLTKLAKRRITTATIARAFTSTISKKKVSDPIDHLSLPPAE